MDLASLFSTTVNRLNESKVANKKVSLLLVNFGTHFQVHFQASSLLSFGLTLGLSINQFDGEERTCSTLYLETIYVFVPFGNKLSVFTSAGMITSRSTSQGQ